ncbi:MAG TPA: nuclear transport factor 2 family protein [Verrucomicrobiae bacterium]|jgi:ketosteroid isomerase-like protein|nr:nuclear transport factor 2 family protein [Verrucomicrobiae bacterium]
MKKILTIIPTFIFLVWAAQAQVNAPPLDPAVDKAITRLREGLVDSFNRGDIDKLLTFLDTNAVVTWQNGEVCEGTAAVKAYYDRMMKGDHPVVSKVTSNPKVLGRLYQGDWAVSWGELNDTFVLTDGRELPLNSKFTATIARRGDLWLVTAFHVSVNAFNNPITALTVKRVSIIVGIAGLVAGLLAGMILMRLLRGAKSSNAA